MLFKNIKIFKPNAVFLSILISAAIFLSLGAAQALKDGQAVRGRVVRFHVIANSNSEEDQALKLKVRDAVVEKAESIAGRAKDSTEALNLLRDEIADITDTAISVIEDEGFSYRVSVETESCFFPTKEYGGIALPAGNYNALRIVIGEGKGENFWCVLFPPLCLSAAREKAKDKLYDTLNSRQVSLIVKNKNDTVNLRFKIIDWFEKLRHKN